MDLRETRKDIMNTLRQSNPEVFQQARQNKAIGSLFPEHKPKRKIKNMKEEYFMARRLPRGVQVGAPTPEAPATPATPPAPQTAGTGVQLTDIITQSIQTSISFRPKAVIVDKDAADLMEINMKAPEIEAVKAAFENDDENIVDTDDGPRVKRYTPLRAIRDACIANPNMSPLDFAVTDRDGNVVTKAHKPNVRGYVITFPSSEGEEEVTSIIKKSSFVNEIADRGGQFAVGDIDESKLDVSKQEIPVVIRITPYQRQSKDGEIKTSQRITGVLSNTRQKAWFPNTRAGVSMYNIFAKFPVDEYQFERVIPRNIHKTVTVGNKEIAHVEVDLSDEKAKSKLPRYAVVENTLEPGMPGYEIASALGITGDTLSAAFASRRGGVTGSETLETTEDIINSVLDEYRQRQNEYSEMLSMMVTNR